MSIKVKHQVFFKDLLSIIRCEELGVEQPLAKNKSLGSQFKGYSFRNEGSKTAQSISQDIKIPDKNENLQPTAARDTSNPKVELGGQTKVEIAAVKGKSRSRPGHLQPQAALNNRRANPSPPTTAQKKVAPPPALKRPVKRKKSPGIVVYALRLLIFGMGTWVIAGTLLSALNPATRMNQQAKEKLDRPIAKAEPIVVVPPAIKLNQEIMPLKAAVQQLGAKNKGLTPGA
ncbi:MAG: hypothetical protein H0U45_12055, partial [Tatlockia sp.]|nr:hypothetical protein [Tatlockia sp.]